MDDINDILHHINPPEEVFTTYQAIEEELEYDWKEEFVEAMENGNQKDYENNEYFTLYNTPVEKWSDITENYVIIFTENQGVWHAGYLLSDLKNGVENPPIYISTEDDFITFKKIFDTTEDFLFEIIKDAAYEYGYEDEEYEE